MNYIWDKGKGVGVWEDRLSDGRMRSGGRMGMPRLNK